MIRERLITRAILKRAAVRTSSMPMAFAVVVQLANA
jgi:hypothetical protein